MSPKTWLDGIRFVASLGLVTLLLITPIAIGPPASAGSTPTGVRTSNRIEIQPAAGEGVLAWSENSRRRPARFNLFVKQQGSPRFKVNPGGTQAFAGDIEGSRLVYHKRSRRRKSDIKFLDLDTRTRSEPAGVNTRRNFESQGSLSGDWLLFWRQRRNAHSKQKVLLRNLVTQEQRLLAVGKSPRKWTQPGRIGGDFAVYVKCRNPSFCNVFRYDIETGQTEKIPNPGRKALAAASVGDDGTVYFLVEKNIFACRGKTSLWRFTPEEGRAKILSLGRRSVSVTSPLTNDDDSTTIFYDVWKRRCRTSDVFKLTLP